MWRDRLVVHPNRAARAGAHPGAADNTAENVGKLFDTSRLILA
jgi:hypothetical protein